MKRLKKHLVLLAAAVTLAGCSGDPAGEPPVPRTGAPIRFAAMTGDSRATVIHESDIESLRLFAYQYTDNTSTNIYIPGELVYPVGNGDWMTRKPYYWPEEPRALSFMAYTPADVDNFSISNGWETDITKVYFYYYCPTDPGKQTDILFAIDLRKVNHGGTDTRVQLWFNHIFAGVKFRINGIDPKLVESVTLKGIYAEGLYYPSWNNWHFYNLNGENSQKADYSLTIGPDGEISDSDTMMIIPQTTPGDATIEVRLRDGTVKSQPFGWRTLHAQAFNTVTLNIK